MTIKGRNIAAATITATNLAANAVTAAKLSTTLATGCIELPLAAARQIVSSNIGVIAVGAGGTTGSGGILGSDGAATYSKLIRVNAATDKKFSIICPADAANLPLAWDFHYPPDLDDSAAITVKFLANMAGATDIPVVAVGYFESGGAGAYAADTNAGGNTAAVTGTTVAVYSRTIAAGDVGAAPVNASVDFTVATHTTNLLTIYGVWIEYSRI